MEKEQEQRDIHRLYRHLIKSNNPCERYLWFKKQLVKDSGKFSLSVRFRRLINLAL
jgi:hypothetical protein